MRIFISILMLAIMVVSLAALIQTGQTPAAEVGDVENKKTALAVSVFIMAGLIGSIANFNKVSHK